jgi:hypothetical protein
MNHLGGGRGVYILDPDGIAYEFFTAVPWGEKWIGSSGRAGRLGVPNLVR